MPLAEALPLKGLLAPIAEFKQRIAEALNTLPYFRPPPTHFPYFAGMVQALMPLAEAMPLKGLLAPVAEFKQRITEALETLIPDPQPAGVQGQGLGSAPAPAAPMSRSGTTGAGAGPVPCRALGPALLAVLDYLKAVQRPPFQPPEGVGYGPTTGPNAGGSGGMAAGAQALADLLPPAASPVHLLLFLSGPPDLGPGRVVNPKRPKPSPSAAVAEAGVVRAPPHTSHTSVGAGGDVTGAAAEQQLRQLSLQQQQQQQGGGYSEAGGSYYEPSPETNRFYEGAAVAAAALGVCVDVYAVSPGLVRQEQFLDEGGEGGDFAKFVGIYAVSSGLVRQEQSLDKRGARGGFGKVCGRLRCQPWTDEAETVS